MTHQPIQQWVVGGAVRDVLLQFTPKDIDFCWTGATVEDMLSRGFTQVGAAFPVFLDKDGNEHALARQERKVGAGYNGFECQFDPIITIEDDLARRDLTINSMAVKIEDWDKFVEEGGAHYLVVDPFGGIDDLEFEQLRHTSIAFAEDPIRILRTARLSARYGFVVHWSTIALMKYVVPELSTVPPERIWAEFQKGLMEAFPTKMMIVLSECGALDRNGPLEPYRLYNLRALERTHEGTDINVRFALISENFCYTDYASCRIPVDCARVSSAFHSSRSVLPIYLRLDTASRLQLLERLKALNDTRLISKVLEAWECDGDHGYEDVKFNIQRDLVALKTVDCATIANLCTVGNEIKQKIFDARIRAMEAR
jgi:tRNA nucleotidyltransferase (CCA-adding enzyme)